MTFRQFLKLILAVILLFWLLHQFVAAQSKADDLTCPEPFTTVGRCSDKCPDPSVTLIGHDPSTGRAICAPSIDGLKLNCPAGTYSAYPDSTCYKFYHQNTVSHNIDAVENPVYSGENWGK